MLIADQVLLVIVPEICGSPHGEDVPPDFLLGNDHLLSVWSIDLLDIILHLVQDCNLQDVRLIIMFSSEKMDFGLAHVPIES